MANKRIELHALAREEIAAAHEWYRQRNPRLGARFLAALDNTIDSVRERPQSFRKYVHHTRRALLRRFPYLVIFREFDDAICILAVAHGARRRGYWKERG